MELTLAFRRTKCGSELIQVKFEIGDLASMNGAAAKNDPGAGEMWNGKLCFSAGKLSVFLVGIGTQ
jgi:hypothetical protein